MAHGLDHPAHLAVTPLGNRHAVPAITALAAAILDAAKLRHAVVQAHTVQQQVLLVTAQGAQNPHRVFALQAETRMHQLVGQVARTGKKQQAFGIEV